MTSHTGVIPASPGPRKSFIRNNERDMEENIEQQKMHSKNSTKASSQPCLLFCRRIYQFLSATMGRAQNPLPENPTQFQHFKHALMCPPQGILAAYITSVLIFALLFGILLSILGNAALPGSNLFSLWVLFVACITGGYFIQFIKLPPLLGMLIVGILLKNIPYVNVARDIENSWASTLRNTALTVILTRAGLGLNPVALRKLSFAVIRLAFCPCLTEALAVTIASHFLLSLPWIWGMMLGFVVAAVSPAVVVPCLLHLQENGYGIDKGIPTLVIAAASIDDVLAITGFGVVLGIAFSEGNIVWSIFKGPLEALLGIVFGAISGIIIWYIPSRKQSNSIFLRGFLLIGTGLAGVLGSPRVDMPGTGPLMCLTVAFVAAVGWRKNKEHKVLDKITNAIAVLWLICQPFLFGLIGAEVNVDNLNAKTIGYGVATLAIGLFFRTLAAFFAVYGTDLLTKEKLFVALAWLPKATVQAAIGYVALSTAQEENKKELEVFGQIILEVAVLVILITAPIGSALVMLTGPRLLKKTEPAGMPSENLKALKSEANDDVLEQSSIFQESTKM